MSVTMPYNVKVSEENRKSLIELKSNLEVCSRTHFKGEDACAITLDERKKCIIITSPKSKVNIKVYLSNKFSHKEVYEYSNQNQTAKMFINSFLESRDLKGPISKSSAFPLIKPLCKVSMCALIVLGVGGLSFVVLNGDEKVNKSEKAKNISDNSTETSKNKVLKVKKEIETKDCRP